MKNPNANVVLAFISFVSVVKGVKVVIGVKAKCKRSVCDNNQQDYCAGGSAIVVQVRAEANLIWLCREQPTINRINLR